MIFALKTRLWWCLAATVALTAAAWWGTVASGWAPALAERGPSMLLPADAAGWEAFGRQVLMGLGLILISDAAIQNALWLVGGEGYRRSYRTLTDYFTGQSAVLIAAAGLLAAAEELLFRGLLMMALQTGLDLSARDAILLSALAFAGLHVLPDRRLWPFAVWAVWEGVVLGYLYHMTGSVAVTAVVHALHDVAGFTLFAIQRKTGWFAE